MGTYCWFEVQSETSWIWSLQLFSVIIQLTYPGIRFILQKSVNVNFWMASCLQIIHCGNLVQMAKSCKVTVDGPDRRYFIPRLAELRVPHWRHHTMAAVWRESPGPTTTNIVLIYGVRNFLLGGRVHQAWPRFTPWLLVHMMCKSFVYRPWWSQLQLFHHQLGMFHLHLSPPTLVIC